MSGQSFDGHGGFVRQSNRMPKSPRKPGSAPKAQSWLGKPSQKVALPLNSRKATTHQRPGSTSPVQRKPR
jgi:hypothetical protein